MDEMDRDGGIGGIGRMFSSGMAKLATLAKWYEMDPNYTTWRDPPVQRSRQ
jgi:hypothetical protein